MAGNTAQVYDQLGNVYQAVQLTAPTAIHGITYPAGWWQVTDQWGNVSAVRPDAFNTMFSPAQGIYLLNQPGGAAGLNNAGLVIQHSQWEGQAGGVATLKPDGTLQQTSGLVLSSSLGVANGVPQLDGNAHVVQQPAMDTTEASTNDPVSTTATIVSNFNRIRYQLSVIYGAAWNAAIAILDSAKNIIISPGAKLTFGGQTSNIYTSNVPNQAVGTFSIPAGAADGSLFTINNTLVTGRSIIFFTIQDTPDNLRQIAHYRQGDGVGAFFRVQINTNGNNLVNSVNVGYLIIN